MQSKIKIFILGISIILSGVNSVNAITVTSSLITTSINSITSGPFGGNLISGDYCSGKCWTGGHYASTIFIDGNSQGTTSISTCSNLPISANCGVLINKTTVYTCTYTTTVATRGACSMSGIQYATSYNHNTISGTSCSDQAPSSRSCTPPDSTPPTASATNASATWKTANISITLSASDTGGSGLSTAKYRWDNSNCSLGTAYSNGNTITLSTEGTHTLYLCVTDVAGNAGTWNGTYKLDKTLPTASATNASATWKTANISITLSASDTGGSGLSTAKYRWDNSNCSLGTTYSNGNTITLATEGTHTLYLCVTDVAGNAGTWNGTYKLDKTLPTASATNASATWKTANISIILSASDTGGSGLSTAKYSWDNANCSAGTDYTNGKTIILSTEGTHILYLCVTDIAGNAGTWNGTYKLDKTAPTTSDIMNNNPTNLLANSSYNYLLSIRTNGGSPIVQVIGAKENSSNEGLTLFTYPQSWDISNVDKYRDMDNNTARQYTFRLTRICDEALNCWNGILDYNHNVYADSLNLSGSVTKNTLDDGNTADGNQEDLIITLEDTYGNDIIPTPLSGTGIERTVDFTFNTQNDVYLNQYAKIGNGIYLTIPNDFSNYQPRIPISFGSITTTFLSQNSTNGIYPFKFKIYTPTHDSYEKSDSSLYFANIQASIKNTYDSSWNQNKSVGSNFSLKSKPLYYTDILGDIKTDGFIEGTQQENSIQVSENTPTTASTTNNKLYLEFGSGNTNDINTSLNLKVGSISGSLNLVGEGYSNYSLFNSFSSSTIYPLFTNLQLQAGGTLNDIQNSYFSTHVGYTIDGKDVLYNTDIYGKGSYWGTIGTGGTYASSAKIIGKTYSKDFKEILAGQSGTDVKLLNGSITKSSVKTEVRRNAYNIIKNISLTSTGDTINNSDFISNTDGIKLLSGSMIYFGSLNGQNITLNPLSLNPLTFVGNKTILIEGGNLYIKGNINVSGSKSMLSIVVLKDSNGNGGNIYIDPNVSYIKAVIYADKSLISYDGFKELDGNTSFSTLKNQLYIYGSVFSENTIGGSRANPIKCPYYVNKITDCDTIEKAQKYDLNYLRRYYLKDTDSDGIGDTPAGGGSSVFSYPLPNSKYPVVIQYNPLIQTNPSILFRK